MSRPASTLLAPLLLACAARAVGADYWTYQYKDFNVLAQGSAAYAQSIGRQLNALDQSLQKMLSREPGAAQAPTRVYALQPTDYAPIESSWVDAGGAFFSTGQFEHVLVVPSENDSQNANRAMYAAHARAWLDDQGLARLPDWFKHGFGLMVAAANFDNDQLTIGQEIPAYMERLKQGGWYPVDKLFPLPPDDSRFHASAEATELYDAQCWWLTHVAMIDGSLGRRMNNYLALLLQGQSQEVAIMAGFAMESSTLDSTLKKLFRTLTLKAQQSPIPPALDTDEAVPVDETELKARLAQLAVLRDPQSKTGEQSALEVLVQAPGNEHALLALMDHQLALRQFKALVATVEQLKQSPSLSAAGHADLAVTEISLARMRDSGVQGMPEVAAAQLRADARGHLRRAMELDALHPLPAYALGWLLASQGDVAAVQQLLPAAEQVYYRRPYSAELAGMLVRLYTLTGDTDGQFKFAVVARRLADNPFDQMLAKRRIDKLRPTVKTAPPEEQAVK